MQDCAERIIAIKADITTLDVDVIVNAANSSLLGGGGVDGAIHKAAGPQLLEACRKVGGCPTGEVRVTEGFRLPARFVFHAVGPVWNGGGHGEEEKLASCYRLALREAVQREIRSIAFPAISTGVYQFPLDRATRVAVRTTMDHVSDETAFPELVIFVCFDEKTVAMYEVVLGELCS